MQNVISAAPVETITLPRSGRVIPSAWTVVLACGHSFLYTAPSTRFAIGGAPLKCKCRECGK